MIQTMPNCVFDSEKATDLWAVKCMMSKFDKSRKNGALNQSQWWKTEKHDKNMLFPLYLSFHKIN